MRPAAGDAHGRARLRWHGSSDDRSGRRRRHDSEAPADEAQPLACRHELAPGRNARVDDLPSSATWNTASVGVRVRVTRTRVASVRSVTLCSASRKTRPQAEGEGSGSASSSCRSRHRGSRTC